VFTVRFCKSFGSSCRLVARCLRPHFVLDALWFIGNIWWKCWMIEQGKTEVMKCGHWLEASKVYSWSRPCQSMLYPADPEHSGDGTHFIFHYWNSQYCHCHLTFQKKCQFFHSTNNWRQSICKRKGCQDVSFASSVLLAAYLANPVWMNIMEWDVTPTQQYRLPHFELVAKGDSTRAWSPFSLLDSWGTAVFVHSPTYDNPPESSA
jgi:hypothetical protein